MLGWMESGRHGGVAGHCTVYVRNETVRIKHIKNIKHTGQKVFFDSPVK